MHDTRPPYSSLLACVSLQGSTVGRAATKAERARGPSGCVYKDLDLENRGTVVNLGPGRREAFLAQIAKDAAFLESLGIMDYSLLLGIHRKSAAETSAQHVLLGPGRPMDSPGGEEEEEQPAEGRPSPLKEMPALPVGHMSASGGSPKESTVTRKRDDSEAPGSPILASLMSAAPTVAVPQAAHVDIATGLATSPRSAATSAEDADHEEGETGSEAAGSAPASDVEGEADTSAPPSDAEGEGEEEEERSKMRHARVPRSRRRRRATSRPIPDEELLGIIRQPNGALEPPAPTNAAGGGISGMTPEGRPSDEIYYLGIIDILQQYDARKMTETVLKGMVLPVAGISAVSPAYYAKRFVEFVKAHVV